MEKQLIFNSVICLYCGEQLISRYTHDYKTCNCENNTFIDGGFDYTRFGGKDLEGVQQFQIFDDEKHEVIRFYLERGTYGKDGKQPLHYVKLKDIDDDWLNNIIVYEEQYKPTSRLIKHYKKEIKYRKNKKS